MYDIEGSHEISEQIGWEVKGSTQKGMKGKGSYDVEKKKERIEGTGKKGKGGKSKERKEMEI